MHSRWSYNGGARLGSTRVTPDLLPSLLDLIGEFLLGNLILAGGRYLLSPSLSILLSKPYYTKLVSLQELSMGESWKAYSAYLTSHAP